MSTTSITRASPPRRSTSSTSRRSRCCAGRRARSTARTPPPARSTSPPASRPSSFEGRAEVTIGNLGFKQAKAAISGPLYRHPRGAPRRLGHQPARHDLQRHQRPLRSTSRTTSACAASCCSGRTTISTSRWRATTAGRIPNAAAPSSSAPARRSARSTGSTTRWRRRRAITVVSRNPFDRLTDIDADLNAGNKIGGVSLRVKWDIGAGHADLGHRLALLGLEAGERPRLHRPADHHAVAEPVAAEPVHAGVPLQLLRAIAVDFVRRRVRLLADGAHPGHRAAGLGGQPLAAQPGQRAGGRTGCATPTSSPAIRRC